MIGSEAVVHFGAKADLVVGLDNNQRREFFGPAGDTTWNRERLRASVGTFRHETVDIRDRAALDGVFSETRFDLIVHCAAQPSHDRARDIPLVDFDVNAGGTINLLEATRAHCPDAVFILMSTNKVYGDAPNELPLEELETRWDYRSPEDRDGIDETCRIDRTMHSLFGASKAAADLIAQEYGRYFGMNVGVFRGGCLTGEHHSAVQLHGFLSYLVKVAVSGGEYTIFGYKGKQVRDQIHSSDVIAAMEAFAANPRPGEVYNIGGGRENSASILECITMIEELTGGRIKTRYQEEARRGDHICYISDLGKLQREYPGWRIRRTLPQMVESMVRSMRDVRSGG